MAECIVKNARKEIVDIYQNVLYEGESIDSEMQQTLKLIKEKLTVNLLEKHKNFSESSSNK